MIILHHMFRLRYAQTFETLLFNNVFSMLSVIRKKLNFTDNFIIMEKHERIISVASLFCIVILL